jgi:hypothetical protein
MSLLKSISGSHPLSMASFIRWVTARNTLHPYTPFLKRPIVDLPLEMSYGILMLFFGEQGFSLGTRCSSKGRTRIQVYLKRPTGTYAMVHDGKWLPSGKDAMEEAVRVMFRKMERRLDNAMTPPEGEESDILVGLDVDSFLTEARKKELSWLL